MFNKRLMMEAVFDRRTSTALVAAAEDYILHAMQFHTEVNADDLCGAFRKRL